MPRDIKGVLVSARKIFLDVISALIGSILGIVIGVVAIVIFWVIVFAVLYLLYQFCKYLGIAIGWCIALFIAVLDQVFGLSVLEFFTGLIVAVILISLIGIWLGFCGKKAHRAFRCKKCRKLLWWRAHMAKVVYDGHWDKCSRCHGSGNYINDDGYGAYNEYHCTCKVYIKVCKDCP